MKTRVQCLLVALLMCGAAVATVEEKSEDRSMGEHVTCGVLFRILAGGMLQKDRTSGVDYSAMATWYKERAFEEIAAAKRAAADLYGDDLAGEIFDEEWQAVYGDMMNQIDRNYQKLSRLRYRYGDRCEITQKFEE